MTAECAYKNLVELLGPGALRAALRSKERKWPAGVGIISLDTCAVDLFELGDELGNCYVRGLRGPRACQFPRRRARAGSGGTYVPGHEKATVRGPFKKRTAFTGTGV